MRRLLAALALAVAIVTFGTTHLPAPHASSIAGGGPTVPCNGTPGPC